MTVTSEANEKSRAVWDEMAAGWDRYRDYIWRSSAHIGGWIVDRVDPKDGDRILDLAGGAGDMAFLAAARVAPSGTVIATDFAPAMVEVARRRSAQLGIDNVEHRILDAQAMDLDDDSVDGVVCRWGLMLMLDPRAALRECRRVLKGGRRCSFSVWAGPEKNPWVTVTGMTMVQLGYEPGGDPFGPGGMFSMAQDETIRSMVTEAGFGGVEIEEMPIDWTFGSFDETWEFVTTVAGALAALVRRLPDDDVQRFRAALQENLLPFTDADGTIGEPGVAINAVAW